MSHDRFRRTDLGVAPPHRIDWRNVVIGALEVALVLIGIGLVIFGFGVWAGSATS